MEKFVALFRGYLIRKTISVLYPTHTTWKQRISEIQSQNIEDIFTLDEIKPSKYLYFVISENSFHYLFPWNSLCYYLYKEHRWVNPFTNLLFLNREQIQQRMKLLIRLSFLPSCAFLFLKIHTMSFVECNELKSYFFKPLSISPSLINNEDMRRLIPALINMDVDTIIRIYRDSYEDANEREDSVHRVVLYRPAYLT